MLRDAILIVFALWWLEVADNTVTLDVSAESNVATSISGLFNTSLLSLLASLLGLLGARNVDFPMVFP